MLLSVHPDCGSFVTLRLRQEVVMSVFHGLCASAVVTAAVLIFAAGSATAADFGDESGYGMQVPYIQGELAGGSTVLVGRHYRVPPPAYYPPPAYDQNGGPDYTQSFGQYPDSQDGAYAQEPLPPRPNGQCLQSWQIERMLSGQGWRGFVNSQKGVDVVGLTARRPNGLTYRLKLDRCTGVIIQANLLDQPDTRRSYTYNPDVPPPGY
jgi:hypothetical protein